MIALSLALSLVLELEQPDIVLMVADDLGKDALTDSSTPQLDKLAEESVRFTRWYTQTNCSPTRIMLLTGKQPLPTWDLGTIIIPKRQDANASTNPSLPVTALMLPEALKTVGYSTAAFGKWHVSNFTTIRRLFEAPRIHGFDRALCISKFGIGTGYGGGTEGADSYSIGDDGLLMETETYNTTRIGESFIQWWNETPSPKFAYVAFNAPHSKFHAPPKQLTPSNPETGTDRSKYLAMVESLDTVIGQMLNVVDPARSIIVFCGDNGTPEEASRAALKGKVKYSMNDWGVSPPLFIRGPGFTPRESHGLSDATDLWPTLAHIAGYKGDVPTGAHSLLPILSTGAESTRRFVTMAYRSPNGSGPYEIYLRAIFDGRFKLVMNGVGPSPATELRGPNDISVEQDASEIERLKKALTQSGY